jgi:hypothetical protein
MAAKRKSKDTPKRPKNYYSGEKWKPGEMREYLKSLDEDPRNR